MARDPWLQLVRASRLKPLCLAPGNHVDEKIPPYGDPHVPLQGGGSCLLSAAACTPRTARTATPLACYGAMPPQPQLAST